MPQSIPSQSTPAQPQYGKLPQVRQFPVLVPCVFVFVFVYLFILLIIIFFGGAGWASTERTTGQPVLNPPPPRRASSLEM